MDGNHMDIVDEMRKLKCHLCNKYLSVSPIFCSNDETKFQCGRCKDIECGVNNKCILFERIAKFLTVPCIYSDCKELLLWEEVLKHEEFCAHRTMLCPVFYSICEMEFKIESLADHMEIHHEGNVHEEILMYDLMKNHITVNVLEAKQIIFLIFLSYKKVSVVSMKPNTSFIYNLKLSGDDCSLVFENQIVNEYNEITTCFECLGKTCPKIYHPYSKHYAKENKNMHHTVLDMDVLKAVFGDFSTLKFIIEISTSNKSKEIDSLDYSFYTSRLMAIMEANNDALRATFECALCHEYMIGPIFCCQTTHSICGKCKFNRVTCSLCQSVIGSSRNFSLESLAENTLISCSNRDISCNFTGNLKAMSMHEEACLETQ